MPVSQRVIAAYLSQRGALGGGAPAPVAPTNTVAPVVSGTATVGQTLSTTTGTWTGDATIVYTYRWQRAGVNIGSATAATYALVDADYGSAIRCVVTGTNGAGNSSANSNATAAVNRTYSQEVLADSPVLYWKLDETSGTTAADSAVGGTYPGSHLSSGGSGIPLVNQTPLISTGKSVLYKSGANLGRTDTLSHPNLGDVFTLEAWIYLTTTGTIQSVMQGFTNNPALFTDATDHLVLQIASGGAKVVTSTTTLSANTAYHVVATKNGASSAKLYINGVDVSGVVTNFTFADSADTFHGFPSMGGYGDELATYTTALSAARVAAHYAARTR